MNKLFNLVVCVIAIMAMSSCSFFEEEKTQSNQQENSNTIEGLPQEIRNKIAAQDTLMNELVSKVDTLAEAFSKAQQENAKLKAQVDNLKSPKNTWAYVSMGAFALSLVAIIMSLFFRKGVKVREVYKIFDNCINDSHRIKELQVNVTKLISFQKNSRSTPPNASYDQNTESRFCKLENQMSQVIAAINKMATSVKPTTQSSSDTSQPHKDAEYLKVGYAKNDMGTYFTTIYESNQEGCVFKITFTSPIEGNFTILSLDKIQSRNDWQQKVECSGISIKDASDFIVENLGTCKKINKDTWQVEKPLRIRLKK